MAERTADLVAIVGFRLLGLAGFIGPAVGRFGWLKAIFFCCMPGWLARSHSCCLTPSSVQIVIVHGVFVALFAGAALSPERGTCDSGPRYFVGGEAFVHDEVP